LDLRTEDQNPILVYFVYATTFTRQQPAEPRAIILQTAPDSQSAPIKVIYILGWGHSGSTLLDLVIGSSPNVMSLGEIIFFDYYRDRVHHRKVLRPFDCTCGSAFHECAFWSKLLAMPGADTYKIVYDVNNGDRLIWLWRLLRFSVTGGRSLPPSELLGDDAALLSAVKDLRGSNTEYLCDSSKDFARLIRLLMMPRLEIYPIFLVRDMRAVALSYAKKKRHDLGLNKMGFYKALFAWAGVNLVSLAVAGLSRRPLLHISYDLFCRDPRKHISLLNERLGLKIDPERHIERINGCVYHNVGGNLMRFKKLSAVRLDDQWRHSVPAFGRFLSLVCFGLLNWLWVQRDSTTTHRAVRPH
jgi:hypothetical protein